MALRTPTGDRPGERGYTLALVVGILTVIGIAVGAALPGWAAAAQREREEELIARGFQYAEAIRVFQGRFGRLPNRLEELVEVEPRSIRQLWEDPMPEGGWLVLIEGPGGRILPLDPETGELVAAGGEVVEDGPRTATARSTPRPPRAADGSGVAGPIHGVKSRATGEAYHVLFDRKEIGDWEFTVERLVAATSATGPEGLPRRAHYGSIGRPFRYPPPGGEPGATPGKNLPPSGEK
jgi:type II secretory pathway pseudopilin PulG